MDEDQDFYDGFEDDDDLFHEASLRRAKKKKKNNPNDSESETGAVEVGESKPAKATYATLPLGVKVGIVVALIVGVVTGLAVAGGTGPFGGNSDQLAGEELPEGHPDISGMGNSEDSSVGTVEGLAELVALVAQEPDNLDAKLDLGVAYFNADMYDEAGKEWREILAVDPDNVPALYSMGFYYLSIPEPDEAAAEESWKRVVELDPESVAATNATAHIQTLLEGTQSS